MNDKEFWDLIAWANAQGDCTEERQDAIKDALAELPPVRIEDFYLTYDRFVTTAWTPDVSLLAYLVNRYGGFSDKEDLFDFVCWLIDQGPLVYRWALTDPDRLAGVEVNLSWESEGYWRNACFAWEMVTQRDERAFYARVRERGTNVALEYPADGAAVDDDDLRRRWPKLCKRFIDERPNEEDL